MTRGKAKAVELSASITKVQMEFLDSLVATGEIATDRAGVVQHLIAQEIERLKNLGRVPPRFFDDEEDAKKKGE